MHIVHRLYGQLPLNTSAVEGNTSRSIRVGHDVRIGTGNQPSSKCFVTVSCVATATGGLHTGSWRSSSTDEICEYHRHEHAADELFLHSFCGLTKPVVGMCVQCLEPSYHIFVLGCEYKSGLIIKVCTFMI